MGIFDRMGKVISSNVNSLLDRAEDDQKLIELHLEEMEEQLKRGRGEVVSAVAAEKQLRKKKEDLEKEVETWDKRAELALKSGDEALARDALRQKKRVSEAVVSAESARVESRDAALKMKSELSRMEEKLAELKMKKGTMIARAQNSKGSEGLGAKGGSSAFDNFRKMEEKIEGREAQGAAMAEVEDALGTSTDKRDLEAKFRELETSTAAGKGGDGKSDVEDELAALKKRVRI
jgi:phage shock protein A